MRTFNLSFSSLLQFCALFVCGPLGPESFNQRKDKKERLLFFASIFEKVWVIFRMKTLNNVESSKN